jgi:hypothetical protein
LGTHPVAAKFVPRRLSEDQEHNHADVSRDLVDSANADQNFAKNILTGDENWVYGYDVETEAQSCQWIAEDVSHTQNKYGTFGPM